MTDLASAGISVVVPTHGRPGSLRQVLAGLARQDYPTSLFEVLVVVDGHDETIAALPDERSYPFRLRQWRQIRQGPAAARNLALSRASAPLIVFLDDDVIPDRALLSEHQIAHGADPDVVVIGPLLPPPAHRAPPWTSWEWSTLAEQYQAMLAGEWQPTPRQFYTGNASARLEHLRAVGGFNIDFRRGEDVELGWRLNALGLRFVFQPTAVGLHLAMRSYPEWLAAAEEYGRTDMMLARIRTGGDIPSWVLPEFRRRHPSTRRLALAGLRHPWLIRMAGWAGEPMLRLTSRLGGAEPAHHLCSALFTMAYWSGVADRIGSPRTAELLRRALEPPP